MTIKRLIEKLKEFDDDAELWIHHKLRGKIMPEEITVPVTKIELTVDGILLS